MRTGQLVVLACVVLSSGCAGERPTDPSPYGPTATAEAALPAAIHANETTGARAEGVVVKG